MNLKPGTRLRSVACTTEIVVVKAPNRPVDLRCGGHEMVSAGDASAYPSAAVEDGQVGGTTLGKRYWHEPTGSELLCVAAGEGSLSIDGEPLVIKQAKPLPSSD